MLSRHYKTASSSDRLRLGFNFAKHERLVLVAVLLFAAGLKFALVYAGSVPFNSDEAVVALMARHILRGARPVFYYGQAYMGSLDAWLVAAGYRLLGEGILALRAVQTILYLAYIFSIWMLARVIFTNRSVPVWAVLCAAVPTVLVTTYTTASLGGYGEILVMGNLVLLLGYQVSWGGWRYSWAAWLALGVVSGLAFWTLGMALVYLLPVLIVVVLRIDRRQGMLVGLCLAGFILGSSPWWLYNINQQWAALRMLLEAQPGQTTVADHLASLVVVGLPALFGLRYPWSVELSPLPVLMSSVLIYLLAGVNLLRKVIYERDSFSPGAGGLLGLFSLVFVLVFLLTRFGIDATGRYLLPLNLLVLLSLALLINEAWRIRPAAGILLLVLVLVVNGVETWRAASLPDLITTQVDPITRFDNHYDAELMAFLHQQGELRGYTNYWVSFRLAFSSDEELIYTAELPYKADFSLAPGDNRYLPYASEVAASEKVAYITSLHPDLVVALREGFSGVDVAFDENQIGPYHVFYNLSRRVTPGEIGINDAGH